MSAKKADKPVKEKGFTPMMQQYLDVKNENKDSILMYRLGDDELPSGNLSMPSCVSPATFVTSATTSYV